MATIPAQAATPEPLTAARLGLTIPRMKPATSHPDIRVVKFGGSLLDLPDFPDRFNRYRASLPAGQNILMLVGGGESADVVRLLHKHFQFDNHDGHWLAIRAMQFNAHCIARVLGGQLVEAVESCSPLWQQGKLTIVDPVAWLQHEETQGITIPHRWSFTSDSIAAHIARQIGASVLTLLKSTLPAGPVSAQEASRQGVVDEDFPAQCEGLPCVELLNLRADPPAVLRLN